MILKGRNDIELYSYDELRNDVDLKNQYLSWLNDLEIVKSIISPELTQPKGLDFIEESFVRFTQENAKGFFIKYCPLDKFVGTIKIDKINRTNNSGEIGLMIGEKKLWNKKIGEKACKVIIKYAFDVLKLNRIWGGTDEHNIAMQRLFLKIGFKQEGRMRQINFFEGKYSDNLQYAILREGYYVDKFN
jgi:RimJ/RimL family protein N-acetyltransferase